jgi:AraC-like DNA-binding protein
MTVGDNLLTKRAKSAGEMQRVSFPSNDARVFATALVKLGYDSEAMLAAAQLSRSVLDDPDARVSCEAFGALIGYAMRTRPMKNLGARIAAQTLIGAFPLLDYLVLSSDSVGHGLHQLAAYFRLVGTPTKIEIRDEESPVRMIVRDSVSALSAEFTVAVAVLNLRAETDGRFNPEYVSFGYEPDDAVDMETLLSCKVRIGASWTGVAIGNEAWRLPLRRRDPVLQGLLRRQADELLMRLPADEGLRYEVRRALARRIAGGDTRIGSVARELATSARTLQRRLAEQGSSYQSLVELARCEAAEQYLSDQSLSIAEISYLLGYSEPSALHRAFKRWKGTTPQAFRDAES